MVHIRLSVRHWQTVYACTDSRILCHRSLHALYFVCLICFAQLLVEVVKDKVKPTKFCHCSVCDMPAVSFVGFVSLKQSKHSIGGAEKAVPPYTYLPFAHVDCNSMYS